MASSSRSDNNNVRTPLLSSGNRSYDSFPNGTRTNGSRSGTINSDTAAPLLSWERFRNSFAPDKSSAYIISSAIVTLIVLGSVLVILFLGLGRIFGLFDPGNADRLYIDPNYAFERFPSARSLQGNLQHLTEKQHLAGKSKELAEWMEMKFKSYGLHTQTHVYYPYLNYPAERKVAIYEPKELAYEAQLREDVVPEDKSSWNQDEVPTFHGYSANGDVTARIVYANYGRLEDFKALESKKVNIRGKIVLVRYGKVYRGIKVLLAEERGAVGVLIYSDPADDGYEQGKVYPEGPFRPGSGVQRGSVQFLSIYPGDPLTPGKAATEDAPRLRLEDAKSVPKIPSLPLSYDDAYPLLRALAGEGVRGNKLGKDWVGGLNTSYWSGPSEAKVHLVNQVNGDIMPIYNVIATIPGEEEEDREVILGNHRDGWVFGAVDPGSGSTTLLEIARIFGIVLKRGWRPRRTIKLCSWDAEEYGLVGSTEYVEDHAAHLYNSTVAYLNVDMFEGGLLDVGGSPSLQDVFERVARTISDPMSLNHTLYDNWAAQTSRIGALGSGSDYTPFLQHMGISSLDIGFSQKSGVYHSNYDSFHYMEKFGDPGFKHHLAMTQLWGKMAVALSDDAILPFNVTRYGHELTRLAKKAQASLKGKPAKHGVDFSQVIQASQDVASAGTSLHSQADDLEKKLQLNAHKSRKTCPRGDSACNKHLRSINDKLAFLERKLIDPKGIPSREWYKHIIYAPGLYEGYGAQIFPAFQEALDSRNWRVAVDVASGYAQRVRQASSFLE